MTEPTCDHGLHHKYKIQNVGFVCTACDPTWREVGSSGPYSLMEHTAVDVTPRPGHGDPGTDTKGPRG